MIYIALLLNQQNQFFFGPEFEISDRIQQNPTIYKMLNTEQIAVYLIFSLIVVVALFNMFGALIMMVLEKTKKS